MLIKTIWVDTETQIARGKQFLNLSHLCRNSDDAINKKIKG